MLPSISVGLLLPGPQAPPAKPSHFFSSPPPTSVLLEDCCPVPLPGPAVPLSPPAEPTFPKVPKLGEFTQGFPPLIVA